MIKFETIKIQLGKKKVKNRTLEKEFKLKKNSIIEKTGIVNRYIANFSQTSESIAINCCKKINSNSLKKVTHILSVSNTPYHSFPSIAHFIFSKLNLNKNVNCIGINSGCSGYVDALNIAYDIIKSDNKSTVLLTTSDTYSKFIKNNDKYLKCLFSDGGSATLISYAKNGWIRKKRYSETIVNSQKNLIMGSLNKRMRYIIMDGPEIVAFAIKKVIPKLKEFINSNTNGILIHQAGKIVIDLFMKSIANKKNLYIPCNYKNFGNLVSTSIPLVFYQNFKRINSLKEIILCGFGVGLTHSYIKFVKN
jgi:3-oxoacyl-[acyl-carrier-protein] synthase III